MINEIRNKFESSKFGLSILDVATGNPFYKTIVTGIAKKRIASTIKEKKYFFTIEVTSICNARCIFCPNSKMKRQKGVMTDEVFNKIVERIGEENITPTFFNLGPNGEPLIDKKIFKRIGILHNKFPDSRIYFPTNLSLATKEIQKKLLDSPLDNICVSLNADNSKDYQEIMGLDFSRTMENLKSLIKLKKKTKSKLKIYLKLAANPINKKTIDHFVKKWEKKVDGVGISWVHSWAGAVENGDDKTRIIERYPCRTLFEQINIHANGNIPLCCVDYEGKIVGGNVMKDSLLGSITSKEIGKIKLQHLEGKAKDVKMCANCRFCERGLYWLAP